MVQKADKNPHATFPEAFTTGTGSTYGGCWWVSWVHDDDPRFQVLGGARVLGGVHWGVALVGGPDSSSSR